MWEAIASVLPGDFDDRLQLGYIALVVLAAILVFATARRAAGGDPDRAARRVFRSLAARLAPLSTAPGVGAVLHVLIIGTVAIMGLIGWRIPAEIERLYGDGAGFGLIFPDVTMPMIGRLAQVIGAMCLALIALRLARVFVPIAALVLVALTGIAAFNYVVTGPAG